MIVKMKKISLVVLESEIESALDQLSDTSVLHVVKERKSNEQLSLLRERVARITRTERKLATHLEESVASAPSAGSPHRVRAAEIVDRVEEIEEEEQASREELERLRREQERVRIFGQFDPDGIRSLNEEGVQIRLYLLTKSELKELEFVEGVFVVARRGSLTGIASVNRSLDAVPEFRLPSAGPVKLGRQIDDIETRLDRLTSDIRELALHTDVLADEGVLLKDQIEIEEARSTMGIEGELSHLTGYVPSDRVETLKKQAAVSGWALLARDPAPDDQVPTLVRNRKAIGIIRPVFQMLGTVPGYREHDISFLFLLFFTLFFAMIIGDAGYGFVLLVGSLLSMISAKRKRRPAVGETLLLVLSVATIVWGSLSGTWFGSRQIAESEPFTRFVVNDLSSFNPASGEFIKYFCFIIGTVHIVSAHIWNFLSGLKSRPRIRALSQLGWIGMVLGIFYLVLSLVLDPEIYPMPEFALYMIGGGAVLVVLFSKQSGNFLKGIVAGFGGLLTTFLDSIGAFADVISYIRLFAVGLATVEIAKSFNAMASEMGNGVVGIVGSVLILGLGHALNLAMGALSVVVHGIRLNMLEFSGHLGMEWTGTEYSPLRKSSGTSH